MKLPSSPIFSLLLLTYTPSLWAFHFGQQLPATVTAFEPHSINVVRDNLDSGIGTVILSFFGSSNSFIGEIGLMTIGANEREGQIQFTYTFTTPNAFGIKGRAVGGTSGQTTFTAQPTNIRVVLPSSIPVVPPTTSSKSTSTPPARPGTIGLSSPISASSPSPASSPPFDDSNAQSDSENSNTRAYIIGGVVGGVGFLVGLVIAFFLFRRKWQRELSETPNMNPPSPPPPVIEPYLVGKPPISSSSSDQKGVDLKFENREREEQLAPDDQSFDSGVPEEDSSEIDELDQNEGIGAVDQARFSAMQAQIRLLVERVERIEAVEPPEAPPEYVSVYGST
ncbi:hypothetical protein PM082_023826 [Marasmius tenuissimus]|nr:hypothetical protein PM082_023826 [Marasmius tenuissimus]